MGVQVNVLAGVVGVKVSVGAVVEVKVGVEAAAQLFIGEANEIM